jgi:Fe-S-cluster containining protein
MRAIRDEAFIRPNPPAQRHREMKLRESPAASAAESPGALRFSCLAGCTRCCEVSGFVYLTAADSRSIAARLGLSIRAFEARYVYRTRHLRRLRKPRGSQCHFLRGGGCAIHPVKPVQCRLFPFWPDLVENRAAWRRTAGYCPGIGQGELVQIGDALEAAAEMRRAYPTMY